MKYVTILLDGMADEPIEELGGRTPVEAAVTKNLDRIAPLSLQGMVKTIPDGMKPGSDTANLAVLGYDPKEYYSGRSPLEALSIGVDMADDDIAIRTNFVTLTGDGLPYEKKTIIDHSSGEISTEDCAVLLEAVKKEFTNEEFQFYLGTSYRHCLIWKKGRVVELAQPHDIPGRVIGEYLPEEKKLRDMMERSFEILDNHPVNIERAKKGLNKANSLWFWGAGTKPKVSAFEEKTGKKGAMISAVDLLKGIATGAKMHVEIVPGANGRLDTNYSGKAQAAIRLLREGYDFVYVHIEAPDEMGHQGSFERKIRSIENIDEMIIGPVFDALTADGERFRMLVMPDHPTPVKVRTHTPDPIPFLVYDSGEPCEGEARYSERNGRKTGLYIDKGYTLMQKFFDNDLKSFV
ncbi:MAG: cofactor-independent phosphoglycerate mutase [Lachnospiraceae bacterium]|nr:cofactor-independent phosphoglycerate mutase [Lachnospiraceae bacterium]